jgi:hypothetical protein
LVNVKNRAVAITAVSVATVAVANNIPFTSVATRDRENEVRMIQL